MKDKTRSVFGLCRFSCCISVESLLNQCMRHHIELFDVNKIHDEVFFFCALDQKSKLMKLLPDAKELGTTGVFGFLLSEMKRPFHLFLLCWAISLYFVLSHTLFRIDFYSTSSSLKKDIEIYLTEQNIVPYSMILNHDFDNQLKQDIKMKFLHRIAWIEVSRRASVLTIHFNHKDSKEVKSFDYEPLISTKHAVVKSFDVLHGFKTVHANQVVYPGDVLVQPYLIDSTGAYKPIYVNGKVMGITWYTIVSELENASDIEVLDFLRLLMNARRQIETEISEDEQVLKENILQVAANEGKIRMTVHYTCLEDITKQ